MKIDLNKKSVRKLNEIIQGKIKNPRKLDLIPLQTLIEDYEVYEKFNGECIDCNTCIKENKNLMHLVRY